MDLSAKLLESGFMSVFGTLEVIGHGSALTEVKKGTPFTYDRNNGISVVYDEAGRPWIIRGYDKITIEMIERHHLTRGAFVPHSNDGGAFVRAVGL